MTSTDLPEHYRRVLAILATRSPTPTMTQIAHQTGIAHRTVAYIIHWLHRRGLIQIQSKPRHRLRVSLPKP